MSEVPVAPLRPRGAMPMLGFGTWQIKGETGQRAVETALQVGYRHLDTADGYGNHHEVGAALRNSGIPRDQIFLTSKIGRENLRYQVVLDSCSRFLNELQVDYLDLLLIHWPNNDIPMAETFRALNELVQNGCIRACGVSNFTIRRLEQALALNAAPISVNQVEYHPLLNQKDLHDFCRRHGIVLTAYSPLAQGKVGENETVQRVAKRLGKTPEQVTLRWLLDRGIAAIPKASSRDHIESNFAIFDFQLSAEDFRAIDTIDAWVRLITWDVAEFDK